MTFPCRILLVVPQENGTLTMPGNTNTSGIYLGTMNKIVEMLEDSLSRRDTKHLAKLLKGCNLLLTRRQNLRKADSDLVDDVASEIRLQQT